MAFLAGTSEGIYIGEGGGAKPVAALSGKSIRFTGRFDGGLLAGAEDGVYRSDDGGSTWNRTGADGRMVWDIAAAPDDPRTLYAVTQPSGLYRSRDGGRSWQEVERFMRTEGSDQWCVPANPPQAGRARTVVIDPTNPARLRVGVEVGGVVASDDGGESWSCTLPGGNPDIHVMAVHPARAGVLFATTGFGRIDNSEPMEQRVAGLFGSRDGGATWSYLWGEIQPRYTRPMCIDPRSPHALTVACAPTAFSSYRDEGGAKAMLYRSDDAGVTWRSLGDAAHSPSAANFHGLTPDAEQAGAVLTGTDTGEVWRVSPAGEWTLLATGLPVVQAITPLG